VPHCLPVLVLDADLHVLAVLQCVARSVRHSAATSRRDRPFEPYPAIDDILLASRPSQVPLTLSEEQLEDLGDRIERTLQVVQGLLERADAARAGLHARNSVV
jgi:hypothetical protein